MAHDEFPLGSHDLFPTRIWQARPESLRVHLPTWRAHVLALRAADPTPAGRTVRGGWNSADMATLEHLSFAPLRAAVVSGCRRALAEMGRIDAPFLLRSWVNLHERGGFNFLHMHEGSLLSGSYYLQVPPGSGSFVLRDPRPGVLNAPIKGPVVNGHSDIHLAPADGLLVLFPCWLEHYVEPHEAEEPRIVIAFNAVSA